MKHKDLTLLNAIAPLDKKAKKQVWKDITGELELGLARKIKQTLKLWHTLLLLLPIVIFTSLAPNASTIILNAGDTGWDAILENQQLSIKAVSPMVVGKNEVCVLWIKKNGQIFKITELPDSGVKNVTLGKTMLANFKQAMVIISIENKAHITMPKKMEYTKHL
ncbi:hypothetical protein [uncultured Gammaproteobacteria bacterium]|jgi:hypothetical protein|uniref:Uncharacterized protein n=2 Tax=sulfur-oxidizing symbionts TaxID=32036 RepID=A0A1H6JNW7_9GAMM|nr:MULTISPECIES: hypothetical protein [sulfur-oxidizing symbionts]CAC9486849.1 hypothetical protein [uncultured Gammaproteobacteria bacterium]CAB5498741.1 hypothetical protein AZO1586I_382 [Bathymodiolus thermophilus thioautotrophic gill symbiont]CAC9536132.1 hypothetical protein [uncultured Gammaproteobacteria bacterium]CAC9983046.1 hypothetical protein [uncultured Gammaproteobacteria bacterium]SEH62556.1 conserved hypothetical protein [Bathymodiolus azoricus thioautotrophic gill symbiont]